MIGLGETGRCAAIGAKYNPMFACLAPSECGNMTGLCPVLGVSVGVFSVLPSCVAPLVPIKDASQVVFSRLLVVFVLGRTG